MRRSREGQRLEALALVDKLNQEIDTALAGPKRMPGQARQ
jgi:hypothetical protein